MSPIDERSMHLKLCFAAIQKLQFKFGYGQNSIIAKLKFLGFEVNTASLSNLLSNGKRNVGDKALSRLANGLERLVAEELDMSFDPVLQDFIPAQTSGWVAYIVPDSTRLSTHDFAIHPEGRVLLEQKARFIGSAIQEVVEIGVRLHSFANYFYSQNDAVFRNRVEELLRRGVHYRAYMIDPESDAAKLYFSDRARVLPSEQAAFEALPGIVAQLSALSQEFKTKQLKGKFEIYLYQHLPVCMIYAVDPQLIHGKMMVSSYLYGIRRANCPVLEFTRANQAALFRKYRETMTLFTEKARLLV
ncbi:MAG: hypothetical protein KGS48_03090 [Bacteroidetes bacterium]|nr:hypothetical protein [Bacteroidota bacterium]